MTSKLLINQLSLASWNQSYLQSTTSTAIEEGAYITIVDFSGDCWTKVDSQFCVFELMLNFKDCRWDYLQGDSTARYRFIFFNCCKFFINKFKIKSYSLQLPPNLSTLHPNIVSAYKIFNLIKKYIYFVETATLNFLIPFKNMWAALGQP